MAYIYKITNDINGKIYIGKTLYSIEKRGKEHLIDSKKERCEKRPLYDAMNKYGIDAFHVECIEECTPEQASIAEEYWISKYRTYIGFSDCNGYNATLGGDSKHYADYSWILELGNQGYTNTEIHHITGYDNKTIKVALENSGIDAKVRKERGTAKTYHKVGAFDKVSLELIKTFNKVRDVDEGLDKEGAHKHIGSVCNGKRKSAYGYIGKYIDE